MASQLQKVEEWVKNSTAEERASPYGKGMLKAYVRLKREAKEEKDEAVQISEPQKEVSLPEDDVSIGGVVGGMGAEIAISTAGKYGGAAVGTAILPGFGTAIGYAVGAIGSGIAGSFAAQKAEGRDTLSWGRAISAGLINLIPTPGAQSIKVLGKSAGKGLTKIAEKGVRYGALEGAATGAVEAQATSIIDKGEMASFSETAKYAGIGSTFGAGLGYAGKKLANKLKGKTPEEVDQIIFTTPEGKTAAKEFTFDGYKGDHADPSYVLDREFERSRNMLVSEESAMQLSFNYNPDSVGTLGKIYNKLPQAWKNRVAQVVPSIASRNIADIGIDYKNAIKAGEALGSRTAKAVAREIELDPASKPSFDKFFATGQIDDVLKEKKVVDTLSEFRDYLREQQKNLIQLIDDDAIKGLTPENKMYLRAKIQQSLDDNSYMAREYEIYTNADFKVDAAKKEKAILELKKQLDAEEDINIEIEDFDPETGDFTYAGAEKYFGDKKEFKNTREKAEKIINQIISGAKAKHRGAGRRYKGATNSPIRARNLNEETNFALMDMMGVIRDPAEKARGTVDRITRLVARSTSDKRMVEMLEQMGLASRKQVEGTEPLHLLSGESGLYATQDIDIAIQQLYASNFIEKNTNAFMDGMGDVINSGIGLSKAVKVLGNVPSYFVQIYGNAATVAQLGMNPFDSPTMWNSLRVAASDIDMFASNQKMSKAILKEIKDAEKYGIKGGNIFASDIRSNLERGVGPVGPMLEPFAKAYQVPDTAFRFYAWKQMQEQLKKVYPKMREPSQAENLKNAAAKLVNDVYQNYDKVNPFLRWTTKVGITPQFATFTMELLRNQYNQGRQIKDLFQGKFGSKLGIDMGPPDMAASRMMGARRAAGSAAVLGGTTAMMTSWEVANNVDAETKNALIETFTPEYDENSPLMMSMSADGKKFNYLNSSYLIPQRMISQAFVSGFDGTDETGLMRMAKQEFLGEGAFFYQGLAKAAFNLKEFGSADKITTEEGLKAFGEIFEYAIEDMFTPGQAREVDKFVKAQKPGARYTTNEVFLRQVGWRTNAFEVEKAGETKVRNDYSSVIQEKKSWGTKLKYEMEQMQSMPGLFEARYQEANSDYRRLMQKQAMHYKNLTFILDKQYPGQGAEKAVEVMKSAGLSSKEVGYLMQGQIPNLPKLRSQGSAEVLEEMGLDLSINTEENNKKIFAEIAKVEDRFLRDKLRNHVRKERRGARKGLSTIESIIDAQSTSTQIEMLQDLFPGNTAYYRELLGKKVITREAYIKLVQ